MDAGVELADRFGDSYALLRDSDVAVGAYSTVVVEALAFSCISVAVEVEGRPEAILELVKAGLVLSVRDADGVIRLLGQSAPGKRESVAEELFALARPVPDFERLIEQVGRAVQR